MKKILFMLALLTLRISILAQIKMVKIKFLIIADFPKKKIIKPFVININGKNAYKKSFKPGMYQLKIQHPGYEDINQTLKIPSDKKIFIVSKLLRSIPRRVELTMDYHYTTPPPKKLKPKIVFVSIGEKKETIIFKNGVRLKPGYYKLKIIQNGYEKIEKEIEIEPSPHPLFLKEYPQTIPRKVEGLFDYDIPPPKGHPEPSIGQYRIGQIQMSPNHDFFFPGLSRIINEDIVATYEYNAWGLPISDQENGAINRFGYQSNWIRLQDSNNELLISPTRVYSAKGAISKGLSTFERNALIQDMRRNYKKWKKMQD